MSQWHHHDWVKSSEGLCGLWHLDIFWIFSIITAVTTLKQQQRCANKATTSTKMTTLVHHEVDVDNGGEPLRLMLRATSIMVTHKYDGHND